MTHPILVTGGNGLLGRSLAALSSGRGPIVAIGRDRLDIADPDSVARVAADLDPVAIVNAAALTDVDACERDPEAARIANVEGPRVLARECRARGIPLVHISTDFVFDGSKTEPYTIEDTPNPLSVYGRTKFEGEEAVRSILPQAVIVRTSWVFGPGGKNFASRLFEFASAAGSLKGITDMRGAPTYAPDLAARLLVLLDRGAPGTYHVSGQGSATWHDVARTAMDLAGWTHIPVLAVTVADLGLPAPRPAYSVLRCLLSERLGLAPLRPWQEAMNEFVAARGLRSQVKY